MKITVTESQFIEAFDKMGRETQFTREARQAIFEDITEREVDLGVEEELDVIGVCCMYVEVSNSDAKELDNYKNTTVIKKLANSTVFYGD